MPLACHVVTRLNVGGIARFLEVARDAVDHLVRGVAGPDETEAELAVPTDRIPELRRAPDPLRDLRAFGALVRTLRRLRPAVLHTHASKAGALGRAAARLLGIPCVHTFHGHVLEGYFGAAATRLFTRIERALRGTALLTATGPSTARALEARLGAPVRVLPPGVFLPPPAADARERWRRSFGRPERVALAVARPAAVKDLPRFVAAARGAGYLAVVAGARGVPGALALGHVAAMQDLYAAADVVVSTSRAEGTPYALLEAAYSGVPVAATPVGDVAWVVGGGGIVSEDVEGALRALRDEGLRGALGAKGAARARADFSASAAAPRLRGLYRELVPGF